MGYKNRTAKTWGYSGHTILEGVTPQKTALRYRETQEVPFGFARVPFGLQRGPVSPFGCKGSVPVQRTPAICIVEELQTIAHSQTKTGPPLCVFLKIGYPDVTRAGHVLLERSLVRT